MKKNKFKSTAYAYKNQGFTLIEFLVASALAIIVIMAAGGTYLMTRQLSDSGQKRINVQNDIRNAATAITRDARVAGTFGCFTTGGIVEGGIQAADSVNLGDFPDLTNIRQGNADIILDAQNTSGYGVIWTNKTSTFPAPGNNAIGNALIFVYGQGNVPIKDIVFNADGQPTSVTLINEDDNSIKKEKNSLVLSSCSNAYTFKPGYANGKINVSNMATVNSRDIREENISEISVSKLQAAAYLIAPVNGKNSLLRYELNENGRWGDPELLATNIEHMQIGFAYTQQCDRSKELPINDATFVYSDTPNFKNLPALLQIRLTYSGSGQSEYIINASVRGGNQCATLSGSVGDS